MKLGYIYTSVAAALITLASCGSGNDADKPYVPTKEFLPAYNALLEANTNKGYSYQKNESGEIVKVETPTNGNNNEFYDIEETVRILNGLEIAQMQTHDFYSFLEYMAKQDYSMVPDEIISAKMKLLPILSNFLIIFYLTFF